MKIVSVTGVLLFLTVSLLGLNGNVSAHAGEAAAASCENEAGMHRLDFWLGEWNVHVTDDAGREILVGTNRIEKILDGCAVAEYWKSSRGGEGRSLFYFHPQEDRWKQVWVTARALAVGGLKEKAEVRGYEGQGIRFQGRVGLPDGGHVLDRTTLAPRPDGSVRQLIEYSTDEGMTWQTSFDAIYRRP